MALQDSLEIFWDNLNISIASSAADTRYAVGQSLDISPTGAGGDFGFGATKYVNITIHKAPKQDLRFLLLTSDELRTAEGAALRNAQGEFLTNSRTNANIDGDAVVLDTGEFDISADELADGMQFSLALPSGLDYKKYLYLVAVSPVASGLTSGNSGKISAWFSPEQHGFNRAYPYPANKRGIAASDIPGNATPITTGGAGQAKE